MDILGELPVEITEEILSYLTPEELYCCFGVSKRWRALVNNEHLWSSVLPYAALFPSASDFTEEDIVPCDMELCSTMRKWLTDSVVMKRWSENKPKKTVEIDRVERWAGMPHTMFRTYLLEPHCVWVPSPHRTGPGDVVMLDYPIPVDIFRERGYLLASEDSLFLACTIANLTFLYSRPTSTSLRFHLLEVLAFNTKHLEEILLDDGSFEYRLKDQVLEDKKRLISIWKKETDLKSLEKFLTERHLKYSHMTCDTFAGTDDDRIICLQDYNRRGLLIWNVSTSRVVKYLATVDQVQKVVAGWNGRGLCVSFRNHITCYDSEGRPVDTFVFPSGCDHMDTLLIRSISVVFGVAIYSETREEVKLVLMECERGQRSVRVGFEADLGPTGRGVTVKMAGGPAYPVLLMTTEDATYVYIGLVSSPRVCKWHSITIDRYEGLYLTFLDVVQFVDGTSYIPLLDGRILKVKVQKDSDGLMPDLTVAKHVAGRLSKYSPVVWADSTRLAIQTQDRLIVKAFI